MVKLWVPLLIIAACAFRAEASNGRVALAFPVQGIAVDGDLSDWPAEARAYPITFLEYGVGAWDLSDFQANLRVGYNTTENALYVAVEARDESAVIDTTAGRFWYTQDGAELYLELRPGDKDVRVIQYVIWGTEPSVWGSPAVLARRQSGDVVSAVQRHEGYQCYEWRVDVGRLSRGEAHLRPETALGFDVAVCDKDADGTFSWTAWGPGRQKFWVGDPTNAETRGDLVLVEAGRGTGKLNGRLTWEDNGEATKYGMVRVRSLPGRGVTVEVRADRDGRYALEMPSGRYQLEPVIGRGPQATPTVDLATGRAERVDLQVKPPVGQTRAAGIGQRPWRRFSVPDGLPSTVVSAMLQDRRGNLWFSTAGGGVSRYDGETFTTFDLWTYGFHPGDIPMGSGAPSKGYAEMWGGTVATFPHERRPLGPGQSIAWTEWMYPFQQTEGLTFANQSAAVTCRLDAQRVQVIICPARVLRQAVLVLRVNGREVARRPFAATPASPFRCLIELVEPATPTPVCRAEGS